MRLLPVLCIAAVVTIACADSTSPSQAAPFSGSYRLASVNGIAIPGTIDTLPERGGFTRIISGRIVFTRAGYATYWETFTYRVAATAVVRTVDDSVEYDLRLAGDSAIVLSYVPDRPILSGDTLGSIARVGTSLRLYYLGTKSSYVFSR